MTTVNRNTSLGDSVQVGTLVVTGQLLGAVSSSGNRQAFIYVATGLEGDTFVVALPAARASTNYIARASGAGMAAALVFDAPTANYLVDRFTLVCSAPPTAGDKIAITVEDLS